MSKENLQGSCGLRKKNRYEPGAKVWAAGPDPDNEHGWLYRRTRRGALKAARKRWPGLVIRIGEATIASPMAAIPLWRLEQQIEEGVQEQSGPMEWAMSADSKKKLRRVLEKWAAKHIPTIIEGEPEWEKRLGEWKPFSDAIASGLDEL